MHPELMLGFLPVPIASDVSMVWGWWHWAKHIYFKVIQGVFELWNSFRIECSDALSDEALDDFWQDVHPQYALVGAPNDLMPTTSDHQLYTFLLTGGAITLWGLGICVPPTHPFWCASVCTRRPARLVKIKLMLPQVQKGIIHSLAQVWRLVSARIYLEREDWVQGVVNYLVIGLRTELSIMY
jgi:hypothetical protein